MAELGQSLQSRLIDDPEDEVVGGSEPTAAQLMDPVDLEARLVEARVRRAEALRKKEVQRASQPDGGITQTRRILGRTLDHSVSSSAKTEAWTHEEPPLPQLTAEGRVPVHTARMPRATLALSAALIVFGVASGAAVAYRFLPDVGTTTLASTSGNAAPSVVPVETISDPGSVDEQIVVALSVIAHPEAPVTDAAPRMPGAVIPNTPEESPGIIADGPGGQADRASGEARLIRAAQFSPEPLPKSPDLPVSADGLVIVQEPPSPSLSPPSMPLTDVREALAKRQQSGSPEVVVPMIPVGAEISPSTGAPERIIEAGLGPSPTLGPVFAPDNSSGLPFDLKASIPAPTMDSPCSKKGASPTRRREPCASSQPLGNPYSTAIFYLSRRPIGSPIAIAALYLSGSAARARAAQLAVRAKAGSVLRRCLA